MLSAVVLSHFRGAEMENITQVCPISINQNVLVLFQFSLVYNTVLFFENLHYQCLNVLILPKKQTENKKNKTSTERRKIMLLAR